jgi:hypothetical protein
MTEIRDLRNKCNDMGSGFNLNLRTEGSVSTNPLTPIHDTFQVNSYGDINNLHSSYQDPGKRSIKMQDINP